MNRKNVMGLVSDLDEETGVSGAAPVTLAPVWWVIIIIASEWEDAH